MAFHDVRFPTTISYGSSGGPGFNTNVVQLDSGATQKVSRWDGAVHRFNAAHAITSLEVLSEIKTFYMAHRGAGIAFRYKDWFDYASTADGRTPSFGALAVTDMDQVIGTGDGATTDFQLKKIYASGTQTLTRNITKPVDGTVVISVNGVPTASGWTVNTLTGIVTFTVAPSDGHVIRAGFEFDVPVSFAKPIDDLFDLSLESFGSGNIDIPLVEEVEAGGIEDEINFRGSFEKVFSANMTVSVNHGSVLVLQASTNSLSVSLPDPTDLPTGGPYFFIVNGGANSFALKDHTGTNLIASLASDNGAIVILAVDGSGNKVWYTI